MTILITGATGFLGSHIAEQAILAGYPVKTFIRSNSQTQFLEDLGVECIPASLYDPEQMRPHLKNVTQVVHAAGGGKTIYAEDFYQQNVESTRALLQACVASGASLSRFVLISSLAAHGPARNGLPQTEADPDQPVTHYGRSKKMAENLCLKYQKFFPVTFLRPPGLYGPRDVKFLLMYKQILRGIMPLPKIQDQMSLLYGPDCAGAVMRVLTQPHASGQAYFVEDGQIWSTRRLVELIRQSLGVRARLVEVPLVALSGLAALSELNSRWRQRPGVLTRDKIKDLKQKLWICASDRIQTELGWQPQVNLSQGIPLTTTWYQEQGWLT